MTQIPNSSVDIIDKSGHLTVPWRRFFEALSSLSGGAGGDVQALIQLINQALALAGIAETTALAAKAEADSALDQATQNQLFQAIGVTGFTPPNVAPQTLPAAATVTTVNEYAPPRQFPYPGLPNDAPARAFLQYQAIPQDAPQRAFLSLPALPSDAPQRAALSLPALPQDAPQRPGFTFPAIPSDAPQKPTVTTFAKLPSASSRRGERFFISDQATYNWFSVGDLAAGGGSNFVPVYSDGTDWRIG